MKTHSQYEDIRGVLRTLSNIEDGGFAKIANGFIYYSFIKIGIF